MRRCWGGLARSADSLLERYLLEARRVAERAPLVDSIQQAWIVYRDLHCRSAGEQFEGGTLQPVAIIICRYELTRARVHDIWAAYFAVDGALPEP